MYKFLATGLITKMIDVEFFTETEEEYLLDTEYVPVDEVEEFERFVSITESGGMFGLHVWQGGHGAYMISRHKVQTPTTLLQITSRARYIAIRYTCFNEEMAARVETYPWMDE